jgi:hypothetical protein
MREVVDVYGGGRMSASGAGGSVVDDGEVSCVPLLEGAGGDEGCEAASRLVTDGCWTEGKRDRKVALPIPGDPRKRMSMCGMRRDGSEAEEAVMGRTRLSKSRDQLSR